MLYISGASMYRTYAYTIEGYLHPVYAVLQLEGWLPVVLPIIVYAYGFCLLNSANVAGPHFPSAVIPKAD
jgi:hypothetical protein